MREKGTLQKAYQNALNIDDVDFEYGRKQKVLVSARIKLFHERVQRIAQLQKQGKLSINLSMVYTENQKQHLRQDLKTVFSMDDADIERVMQAAGKEI
ncbi:MAG TPA: hypothetical protein VD905_20305 [Flavobacteriales bacterium]|nr:hypothetical protein [Flavobacteriales bacterium]